MYSELINYAIRSTACLAFFYVFYVIILSNETCFKFNRGYLISTLLLSFVLPLLSFSIAISSNGPIDPNAFILPEVVISDTAIAQAVDYNLFSILNTVYLITVLILGCRLFSRMYHLWKVVNNNRHLRHNKYIYEIIPTNGKLPTSSFLNYLFWDNTSTIDDVEKQQIIAHEKVHILERHTYDILLIELVSIVCWFNPFVWMWKRAISENHEYLADAQASNGMDNYATLLAKHTLALNGFAIIHPFKSSEVIKRLRMLKKYRQQTKWTKLLAVIPLLGFMIFTMSFSVEQILDQPLETAIPAPTHFDNKLKEAVPEIIKNTDYNDSKELPSTPSKSQLPANSLTSKELSLIGELKPMTIPLINKEEVFTIVEETAQPKEGMTEFYQYIAKNLKYPKQARKLGITGRVFVEFIVDKYGNLTEVKAIKGIGAGCDAEAVRAISNAPAWNPGKQRGKAVKQKIVLPITFKLG